MRMAWLAGLVAAPLIGACGDDETKTDTSQPQDTTADTTDTAAPDTAAPDTTTPDTAAPDTLADTAPDTAAPDTSPEETTAEVTEEVTPEAVTWDDVYPIFAASCSPCHASGTATAGSGGHSIASPDKAVAYQASQLDADFAGCAGKKIGECALIRVQDGSMPASGDCRDPKTDKCPDAGEQELIERWIDQGMLER